MRAALTSLGLAAACILAGGTAFSLTQHVSFLTGLYWGVTTASTTGYGDVAPRNATGKVIAIVTMLTTIPLLANAFSHLHLHRHRKQQAAQAQDKTESEVA